MRVVGTGNTGWKTLAEWNANPIALPDGSLAQNAMRTYTVRVRIPSDAGNEIANKSLTNVTFTLTGTQAP